MKAYQCGLDRYEATGTLNQINLELLDGTKFYVGFMAWGDTLYEAIENCLSKMDKHLHPADYERCLTCGKVDCMCYEDSQEDNQKF